MIDLIIDNLFIAFAAMVVVTFLAAAVPVIAYRKRAKSLQGQNEVLSKENEALAKYRVIANAEQRAKEIDEKARLDYEALKQRARNLVEEAKSRGEAEIVNSRIKAQEMEAEARRNLDTSQNQAAEIVELAQKKAEDIAGNALKAMEKADLYEKTVKAMKNLIDGYGDQYLIPSHSLLDDLAEKFDYTQAGQELKKTRELVKSMIRTGTAATCSYVEASRRQTAIEFVVDAFNGKVDSILSRVKHDNAGKLTQEIRDSFVLVNKNGLAFREARITEVYLDARLTELKWAAIAQQLKLKEREEQRQIREQMREEEKARREYERAMKEAARDEEALRKAMAQAQEKIEKATNEQKAEFEKRLDELKEKLKEAEERSQRAMSMAQQTRRGHVYVISNIGSFGENVFKIGLTRRLEPLDRVKELGDSSVPFEFDVHAMIFSEDAPKLETDLHKHFALSQVNKVNFRKEFFNLPLAEIRRDIESMDLEVKWTMVAEATEYRESLAIDKAIKENPQMRVMWLNRQLMFDEADLQIEEDIREAVDA